MGPVALLLMTATLAGTQQSEGTDVDLAAGIGAYEELDYQRARRILKSVLADGSLSDKQRLRALAFLGRVQAILNEPGLAQECFVELLGADPTFEVSWEESPRIREALAAAKRAVAERAATQIPVLKVSPKQRPDAFDLRPAAANAAGEGADTSSTNTWVVVGATIGGVAAAIAVVVAVVLVKDDKPEEGHVGKWRLP